MAGSGRRSVRNDFRRALADGGPLLLDGATGTELERRGVDASLPLWSARALLDAPDVVREIHAEYAEAGADILTANSFRTQRRTLAHAGIGARCRELTTLAVRLAREAAGDRPIWIAGSIPTLEDCYRPDLVPGDEALAREHSEHTDALAEAGADLLLVETLNTVREARAATRAAAATGLPFVASFVSWEPDRILSGEPLEEAIDAALESDPCAVGVNCAPPSAIAPSLAALRRHGMPFAAYANLGGPLAGSESLRSEAQQPDEFAALALEWVRAGASIVGGCCGTTPAHTRAMRRALEPADW